MERSSRRPRRSSASGRFTPFSLHLATEGCWGGYAKVDVGQGRRMNSDVACSASALPSGRGDGLLSRGRCAPPLS